MYMSMIDEHIISIEPSSNWFDATCDFNTKAHFSKREVLMNWNVQNQWYNNKEKKRLTKSWVTICWTLRKALFNFWILIFAFILFTMHFCMIECSYDVIYLFMCHIWCVRCCNYIWV